MPKTRRSKVVHLSKTVRKTKSAKSALIDLVRACLAEYPRVYIFSVRNMRNAFFQSVRQELKESSRFFFGRNRVMAHAMRLDAAEDSNISEVCDRLAGNVGLLFTRLGHEEVARRLSEVGERDFARAGGIATETVVVPAGALHQYYDEEAVLSTTLEEQLKYAGMSSVRRDGAGRLAIASPFTICEEGKALTAEQARLLKVFGVQMAEFGIDLVARYDIAQNEFVELAQSLGVGMGGASDDEVLSQ